MTFLSIFPIIDLTNIFLFNSVKREVKTIFKIDNDNDNDIYNFFIFCL